MLAYTPEDDHPVALLPVSDNRYEIFDPLEETRTLINTGNVVKLATTGYVFYRPFPDKEFKILELHPQHPHTPKYSI